MTRTTTPTQFQRLINHDFPWLWGVRQEWNPQRSHIEVRSVDSNLDNRTVLMRYLTTTLIKSDEVWFTCTEGTRERIVHVDTRRRVGQEIIHQIVRQSESSRAVVRHILFAVASTSVPISMDTYVIFRTRRPEGLLWYFDRQTEYENALRP